MIDPSAIGLKVGLEIHQQLATKHKLFCGCALKAGGEAPSSRFQRRLRPTQSELGEVDPASVYEFTRGFVYSYHAPAASSCLVEADEEPPNDLDPQALEYGLKIALMLGAEPVDEIHVMRKVVIDGSNTTGFQRTAVIALGGSLRVGGRQVPIQSITLEEDACRLIEQGEARKEFSLDRLCIPLIEVSLAPMTATPREIAETALALGRLMRATRFVARGLGTIRQDANISVRGGAVVEVKGIQELDKLESIIEFEAQRQEWLNQLAAELRARGLREEMLPRSAVDVTPALSTCGSKMIIRAISQGGIAVAIPLPKMRGLVGREPVEGVRLGAELADRARAHGLGGVIHSDELPGWGLNEQDVENVRRTLHLSDEDAFVLLCGPREKVSDAVASIIERLSYLLVGVPPETRGPTPDGKTRYMRPRPGAARMYPETDIPPVPITREYLERLRRELPLGWEEQVGALMGRFGLGRQLAEQILDSDMLELFEAVAGRGKLPPTFVASLLTEGLTALRREGLQTGGIDEGVLHDLFLSIEEGRVAKEAALDILRTILKGQARSVREAVDALGLRPMSEEELQRVVDEVLRANRALISQRGERALGAIMGEVMARVRGRIDGATVSSVVKRKMREFLG